jgi:hypothetical protein
MLGRALNLAAVTLLIGLFAAGCAWAQAQNLEAGKSPSQLFAGTCNACHKSPRGLLKTVSAASLPGFLRQHYTTGSEMAAQLSAFLISNGAGDTRSQARQGAGARPANGSDDVDWRGRKLPPTGTQEAARPDATEPTPQAGRNSARQARPGEATDERGDGRRAKQRLSKGSKPGVTEVPGAKDEPQKPEPAIDDRAHDQAAREGEGKPDETKPSGEGKSEAVRIEVPKENGSGDTPIVRADPAPVAAPQVPQPSTPLPIATSGSTNEPAASQPPSPASAEKIPAVTASVPAPASSPPPPPVAADGPPAPPISQ